MLVQTRHKRTVRSQEARARLEAALLAFVDRAGLLATYIECIDARPSLS
jgi:hypothetical protein